MGIDLPTKEKKWLADSTLDILSLLPLPFVHEAGHILMAFLFDVTVVDTFLIPQIRDNRMGIGISVDWRTARSFTHKIELAFNNDKIIDIADSSMPQTIDILDWGFSI